MTVKSPNLLFELSIIRNGLPFTNPWAEEQVNVDTPLTDSKSSDAIATAGPKFIAYCPAKNHLLDQKFVSGIGNIYASEILFESKINPKKKSGDLSDEEMQNIVKYSKIVLNNSIQKGGSSIRNFVNTSGDYGGFQKYFKVYEREGKKCIKFNCKGKIKRVVISNRSTFYCNICQN